MTILTLDVGGSGARYSGVMYRSPTDEIMLDIAAAADDTERLVAAAAAATADAEAVDETGGEVEEPLGEDASDEGEGPFAGGGCSSIVIEVADARTALRPHSLQDRIARTCVSNGRRTRRARACPLLWLVILRPFHSTLVSFD